MGIRNRPFGSFRLSSWSEIGSIEASSNVFIRVFAERSSVSLGAIRTPLYML